ncbi:hypothetical protein [Lentzea sp. NBRC 105346]|uniref:hypothetical protein n=1 Tax=Lentzea sp. NBRC 105346 TaxID=3032205 RepID=UPI002553D476|nr:hypothetical protein [Lentzea sp. NBRC 105346]
MAAKLVHPSAQVLSAEQHARLKAEARTCYWLTIDHCAESTAWQELHLRVLDLVRQIDELDPRREVHIPGQLTPQRMIDISPFYPA